MDKKPIEIYFPIHELNELAENESKAKRHYKPIYTIHKWWARRLGCIFRSILLYTLIDNDTKVFEPLTQKWEKVRESKDLKEIWTKHYLSDIDFGNKIVLDPFFGGGTTVIEALRMGCSVIAKELNPVAWFVTKKEIEDIDIKLLKQTYFNLEKKLLENIFKFYQTICPICKEKADVMYFFWIRELHCLNCNSLVNLFNDYRIAKMRSIETEHKNLVRCETCLTFFNPSKEENCPECKTLFNHKMYHHVVCSQCRELFGTDNYKDSNLCPYCGNEFNPSKGNVKGQFYICHNGHKRKIVETIERLGKLNQQLAVIEYYCQKCDKKGYKKADGFDLELFNRAKAEFSQNCHKVPIPFVKVPNGVKTSALLNHGYKNFQDLFNERQLLNLGRLYGEILNIQDKNAKEFMIIPFSKALDTNNLLCKYRKSGNVMENMFSLHAYHPVNQPIENNVWGSKYGARTFKLYFENLLDALRYKNNPIERTINEGKKIEREMKNKIKGLIVDNYNELTKGSVLLLQGSSEYLEIPDNSIDAVITDPPYYDNVMYSELSDFFYVWLRLGLKEYYTQFRSDLTPKRAEIIKNKIQNKGNKEFTEGLIKVFKECYKKLKSEGLLVFTFHHGGKEAWIAILETILLSNFYVSAVYPIQAEMSTSAHIIHKANIEYDMIIICRKRLIESKRVEWQTLQDEIFLNVENSIKELEIKNKITDGDKFVIAMGKCLEIYSKNWPEVYNRNKLVKIDDAVEDIKNIVDNYFNKVRFSTLEKETDRITAIYLQFLANNKIIDYNELNKAFQQRNLNINEIFEKKLAIKEKNKVKIITYNNRKEYLENLSQDNMIAIDQVHYILNLKDVGKFTKIDLNWIKDEALIVLKRLNVKDSDKLIKYIKKARTQKRIEL